MQPLPDPSGGGRGQTVPAAELRLVCHRPAVRAHAAIAARPSWRAWAWASARRYSRPLRTQSFPTTGGLRGAVAPLRCTTAPRIGRRVSPAAVTTAPERCQACYRTSRRGALIGAWTPGIPGRAPLPACVRSGPEPVRQAHGPKCSAIRGSARSRRRAMVRARRCIRTRSPRD